MSNSPPNRRSDLLVREKLISLQQLKQAQTDQAKSGKNLSYTLAKLGYISDGEITDFLSAQYRLPAVKLEDYDIEEEVIKLVAKDVCEKHRVIPVSRSGSSRIVAMADPTNLHAIDDIKFLTGYNVEPVVASETAIQGAIEKLFAEKAIDVDALIGDISADAVEFAEEIEDENVLELERASEDAPVVRLCNAILL